MVVLSDLFDLDLYDKEREAGYITVRPHPNGDLFILNYSDKAQFDRHWNEVTLNCRGLIIDSEENVVARPWKKFFNFGEGFLEIDMGMPVEVTDKIDGSLGILYPQEYDVVTQVCTGFGGKRSERIFADDYAIATRGSFDSDQARHATKLWRARYGNVPHDAKDHTFLFEIVYPANRIVCNYGDLDDLVLLGAVHNQYGYYLGPNEAAGVLEWPGPVTTVFEYKNMQDAFSNNQRPNAEGYVVRSGNKMVKLKQTDYMELHRIVTNLNARTVWERLGNGETVASICDQIPDEFHQFVRDTATQLEAAHSKIMDEVVEEYLRVCDQARDKDGMFTRKEFAQVASKSKHKAYMFKMLDGQPIDALVWRTLRPEGAKI